MLLTRHYPDAPSVDEMNSVRISIAALGLVVPLGLLLATAAQAGTTTSTANVTIAAPLTIVKTQDMNFGSIVPGTTAGTLVLNATTGAAARTGGVATTFGATSSARFLLTSTNALYVTFSYPNAITLSNGGGATMAVSAVTWTNDAALCVGNACLPLGNNITANFGGTLNVAANQTPGAYTGNFTVTANFQ